MVAVSIHLKSKRIIQLFFIVVVFSLFACQSKTNQGYSEKSDQSQYDIAAYVWPAYHQEPRMKEFYRGDDGEWERIWDAKPKWEGQDQPRQPLWGYVHEDDPKVMEMKIETAHKYGVDIFIYDWYWFEDQPYLENALDNGFLKAKNNNLMKFYLMWANHDANTSWDIERSHDQVVIWPGSVDRKIFEKLVHRWITKYFNQPSYYKIDGKPVFSIYHLPNLVKGLGGLKETVDAMQYFRDEVKKAGFPGLHLQVTARNSLLQDNSGVDGTDGFNLKQIIEGMGANSITSYTWVHHVSPGMDYVQWGVEAWQNMEQIDRKMDIPYFVNVSVGWDNNPRFVEPKKIVTNTTPDSFEAFLLKAKMYVDAHPDQPRLITINAWNEWVEGSYLEPDMRNGYKYLEAIKEVFGEKND
jgi:hypothetical protein